MQHSSVTTPEEDSNLRDWLSSIFRVPGAVLWVDGMYTNGQWVTSNGTLLYNAPTGNFTEGSCVMFGNLNGYFKLFVRDCSSTIWAVGEYFDFAKQYVTIKATPTSKLKFSAKIQSNNFFPLATTTTPTRE